jgi:hypothetical protein
LNLRLVSIFSLALANIIISVPLLAYAVSQYDSDGFTIFPGKSSFYISGYRQGVVTAHGDIKVKMNTTGIDAHQDKEIRMK